ncbi:MAG: hypothetical protein JW712_10600 [Dehalococcoidales bacterium]|nr:hypothetical protein [Dehalococcoidales bacterium]
MPQTDFIVIMGIGGLFVLLGIGAIIAGKIEEKKYYSSITSRPDAREFVEGWPKRSQFGSMQTGGWIAIAIGVLILVIGGIYKIWG